ncbi:glycosyltransferase family 2 protein [Clostridium sp. HBUAS56010]|uniref:glycosyltransferase family 2 protein n=1 Tax=Clostridium sp. HBUAS56010 TaxID=2571127 RepID=UPI0011774040|nr:glycosyltransferase family 2 protein [Clostridium sp. HBUAS56010]
MVNKISIVVSVFNEEEMLDNFYREISSILECCKWEYEIVFVNDGSSDRSREKLALIADKNMDIKVINFSRNFGHEAAMLAGIEYSIGDGIVCMDADLQHPVQLIPEIIDRFEQGYEVISMVRTKNKSAGLIKNITSELFYKVLNMLSSVQFENNASDFFAISRRAAKVIKLEYREKVRFLRGYVQSIGFKKTAIEYEAKERAAGHSKYNIKKLIAFSINALLGFSNIPLKSAGMCGLVSGVAGLLLMIYTIYSKVVQGTPAGYATIIIVICFMFAILFILIGIIGEYLGIIFMEIKDRPIYIVDNTQNISESDTDLNIKSFPI